MMVVGILTGISPWKPTPTNTRYILRRTCSVSWVQNGCHCRRTAGVVRLMDRVRHAPLQQQQLVGVLLLYSVYKMA